jgi:hypothetical protein
MSKILHIWDQASVSCVLAKYQRKLGHEVSVIKRDGFDKFGIMQFYNETILKSHLGWLFLKTALNYAKDYDVIHVHDLFQLIPKLKVKYSNKKIILHYHGTRLRETSMEKRNEAESFADIVLVSTPDLLKFVNAQYLPNPIDVEHFFPRTINKNNKTISLMTNFESNEKLNFLLKENGIDQNFESWPREQKPIAYADMPNFLSNYEYLIDLKLVSDGKPMSSYGVLGLQALSLGLKVINFEYNIVKGLPEQHIPKKIVERLEQIYEK